MTAGPGSNRIQPLDGLRGVAAVVVVAFHCFQQLALAPQTYNLIMLSPLGVLVNGQGAVHVFFVLSGYVLSVTLQRPRGPRNLAQYFVRRLFRIHPPYAAALLLAWLTSFLYLQPGLWPDPQTAPPEWIHISASQLGAGLLFPGEAHGQLPVGWSLRVELVVSFLFPLLLLLSRRSSWLFVVAISGLLLTLDDPRLWVLRFTLDFALGIGLFIERDRLSAWFGRLPGWGALAWLAVAVGLMQVPHGLGWVTSGVAVARHGQSQATVILQAFASAMWVAGALHIPALARSMSTRAAAFFGRISYSLYLIHWTVLISIAGLIQGKLAWMGGLGLFAGVLAASTGLSVLGYRFVEQPSVRAGRAISRWLASPPRARIPDET